MSFSLEISLERAFLLRGSKVNLKTPISRQKQEQYGLPCNGATLTLSSLHDLYETPIFSHSPCFLNWIFRVWHSSHHIGL